MPSCQLYICVAAHFDGSIMQQSYATEYCDSVWMCGACVCHMCDSVHLCVHGNTYKFIPYKVPWQLFLSFSLLIHFHHGQRDRLKKTTMIDIQFIYSLSRPSEQGCATVALGSTYDGEIVQQQHKLKG